MKKTKRILCALLAVIMIVPMMLMSVSAAGNNKGVVLPAGTVLYENNYEDGNVYANNTLTAADLGFRETTTGNWPGLGSFLYGAVAHMDGSNGAALLLADCSGGLANTEFLSADKMQAANAAEAFTSYVISADITMVDPGAGAWYGMSFGYDDGTEESSATAIGGSTMAFLAWRDWQDIGIQVYVNGGAVAGGTWNNIQTASGGKASAGVGETNTWKVEVDTTTGTANLYIGEYLVQTVAHDQLKTYGAVSLMSCYSAAVIDNLSVTRGTVANPGTAIYSNNFDSLATGRKLLPVNKNYLGTEVSKYTFTYAGVVTNHGDNMLHISSDVKSAANWVDGTGVELVPASAIQNVEKYTIQFTLRAMKSFSTSMWVPFGEGGAYRARVGLYSGGLFVGSYKNDFTQEPELSSAYLGKDARIAIELDGKAGTGKISVVGANPALSHNISCNDVLGAISFICGRGQEVYIDDILVTSGTLADTPAVTYGVQETAVADGKYNVRFIGLLGDKYTYDQYTNVGLTITCGNKAWDTPCTAVYDSIVAGENVGETGTMGTLVATEKGGKYFMAYTIKDIPTSAGEITFTVTSYFETAEGKAAGTTWNIVYNAGEFVSMTIAH